MPALHFEMRETKAQRKARTEQIIKLLKRAHPDAHCALNHSNAFELLVATILSAQCTDERVNIVTADLFRKYRKPEDYLKVPAAELQQDIRTTGFFRNKTKSIQGACKMLAEEFGGRVPQTMEELLKLPGGDRGRHACQPSVSAARSDQAERPRQNRTGVSRVGAANRLDHLFTSADLSRPQGLQSAPAFVRRVRG